MPRNSLSLFVLAGEPSGDRIGAALVSALREKVDLRVTGVGGTELTLVGLSSLYPMSDLSVMGFADVAKRLPLLLWRARQTVAAIQRAKPDVAVLIDSQVFSATIARRLRRKGYRGTVLLYVAPAVWAWKPERAPGLKPLFNEILSVLPFEPSAMQRLGGPPTRYVGHPALKALPSRPRIPERGPLLLLPGSRDGEIGRTLPMMQAVAEALGTHPRVSELVLPTPSSQLARITAAVTGWRVPVRVVSGNADKHAAFSAAVAAAAVSGTVTLELALAGVPTVATYVADAGQAKRFARYKVKFVALPNIILDRELVAELLFTTPEPQRLIEGTRRLLDDRDAADMQVAGFAEIRTLMEKGAPEAPLHDAADEVLAAWRAAQRSDIGV